MSRGFAERQPEARDAVNNLAATSASRLSDTFNYGRPATRKRGNRLSFTTIKFVCFFSFAPQWYVTAGQTATGIIPFDDTVWQWRKTLDLFFFFFEIDLWDRDFLIFLLLPFPTSGGCGVKEDVDNSLVPLAHRGYLNIILNRKVNKHAILFMRGIIWDKSVYCEAAAAAASEPRRRCCCWNCFANSTTLPNEHSKKRK